MTEAEIDEFLFDADAGSDLKVRLLQFVQGAGYPAISRVALSQLVQILERCPGARSRGGAAVSEAPSPRRHYDRAGPRGVEPAIAPVPMESSGDGTSRLRLRR